MFIHYNQKSSMYTVVYLHTSMNHQDQTDRQHDQGYKRRDMSYSSQTTADASFSAKTGQALIGDTFAGNHTLCTQAAEKQSEQSRENRQNSCENISTSE